MVPKWRPEITKSSKWLPKLLFGEKGRILTPLGGPWDLNGFILAAILESKLRNNDVEKLCENQCRKCRENMYKN